MAAKGRGGEVEMSREVARRDDGGGHLRLEDEHATGTKAVVHSFEQALDTIVAPIEVDPFGCTEAHDDRVGGVGISSLHKIFPSETAVVRERKRINVAALPRVSAVFGNLD